MARWRAGRLSRISPSTFARASGHAPGAKLGARRVDGPEAIGFEECRIDGGRPLEDQIGDELADAGRRADAASATPRRDQEAWQPPRQMRTPLTRAAWARVDQTTSRAFMLASGGDLSA